MLRTGAHFRVLRNYNGDNRLASISVFVRAFLTCAGKEFQSDRVPRDFFRS